MDSLKNAKMYFWIWFILFISIFKLLLVQNLPIFAQAPLIHDDRLMVNMAASILSGNWLGEYSQMTLVKGIIYPLFLVLCNLLGIPYLTALTMFYMGTCILFLYICSKMIKNRILLCLIYALLLFNPVTMSLHTFQRIYRCSLTPAQIILLTTAFFAVFYYRNKSQTTMICWSIIAGLSLFGMWNTREDGIWVLPFVLVVLFITVLKLANFYKNSKRELCRRVVTTLLPLIILIVGNNVISAVNYHYYGIYTTNELNNSNFTKFIKTVYSVKPNEEIDYVSVPRETVNRLYDISPTLQGIKPQLETCLDAWEVHGKMTGDMEVEDGWFFWAMRDAVAAAGYYETSEQAEEFYQQATQEIERAFGTHTLKKRLTMPSALMSPWKKEYLTRMLYTFPIAVKNVISFEGNLADSAASIDSTQSHEGIRLFETLTQNEAIYPSQVRAEVSGWLFPKNDIAFSAVYLVNNAGEIIQTLDLTDSEDVYQFFLERDHTAYETAKNCRFSIWREGIDEKDLPLRILAVDTNGEETFIDINGTENSGVEVYFDRANSNIQTDSMIGFSKKRIEIVNIINKVYSVASVFLSIIGFLCYVVITYLYIVKKQSFFENCWLLLTGILGSLLMLLLGIVYTDISAYAAINVAYLSASYPLLAMFFTLAITSVIESVSFKSAIDG